MPASGRSEGSLFQAVCFGPFMKDDPSQLFKSHFVMVVSMLTAGVFEVGMPL